MASACYRVPLLLEPVGGFLKRKRVKVWRQNKKLSKVLGCDTKSFTSIKKYLDDVLEDKPIIKECFMDLGLFPQDHKISIAALVDIWTERQHKPDDDLDLRQLYEDHAMNVVYDLTDWHLANIVVRRYMPSTYFYTIIMYMENYSWRCQMVIDT